MILPRISNALKTTFPHVVTTAAARTAKIYDGRVKMPANPHAMNIAVKNAVKNVKKKGTSAMNALIYAWRGTRKIMDV
jgi:hypothetical protein